MPQLSLTRSLQDFATTEPDVRTHPSISPVLLIAVAAFLFLFQLGRHDLTHSHEARAAQNAQRMLDDGAWGLPVLFDGQADLQKPPGFYWLVAAFGAVNGGEMTPFVARLPAALAGLATVGMVFAFLRSQGRTAAAWVAALGLATAFHYTGMARTARIDMPLAAAVAASVLAFVRGCEPAARRTLGWHLVAASAAAAAVLLKGPIGLALVGGTAVAWLVVGRLTLSPGDRPTLPWRSAVLGPLVVAAVALPWFVWANHATGGEFVRVFVWHHNVARFLGTSPTLASHPWWYYVPRFAVDFLPWTPALAALLVWAVRSGRWHADAAFRLGVVWLAVVVVVLSSAHFKRADYLLPAYPGAALALGAAAEAWWRSRENARTRTLAVRGFAAVVAAVVVGWQVMIFAVEPRHAAADDKKGFADAVRAAAPKPALVLLFRVESHLLAFHLGRPVHTLVEWGELNDRLGEPGPHFIVTQPQYADEVKQILPHRRLVEVARLDRFVPGKPDRPLVFLRSEP